jgi:hypothetical protein
VSIEKSKVFIDGARSPGNLIITSRMTSPNPQQDLKKTKAEYDLVLKLADPFSKELDHQLTGLLNKGGVSLAVPIQVRVKPWSSISEKIREKGACDKQD